MAMFQALALSNVALGYAVQGERHAFSQTNAIPGLYPCVVHAGQELSCVIRVKLLASCRRVLHGLQKRQYARFKATFRQPVHKAASFQHEGKLRRNVFKASLTVQNTQGRGRVKARKHSFELAPLCKGVLDRILCPCLGHACHINAHQRAHEKGRLLIAKRLRRNQGRRCLNEACCSHGCQKMTPGKPGYFILGHG